MIARALMILCVVRIGGFINKMYFQPKLRHAVLDLRYLRLRCIGACVCCWWPAARCVQLSDAQVRAVFELYGVRTCPVSDKPLFNDDAWKVSYGLWIISTS